MKRTLATLALAVLCATPGNAQTERQRIQAQCGVEMGYTDAECACLVQTVPQRLTEDELEYIWVRSTRNDDEIRRMNEYISVLDRLHIFLTVRRVARECAPGKPFTLPDSGATPAETALIGGAR